MKPIVKHLPFGPRIIKTAIAVTLATFLIRLFDTEPLSVFYAAFGALIAMETTVSKSLMQGLTQLVAVLAGTVFGYLSVLLFPEMTPAWVVGLGVLLLIVLCRVLKLSFSISLSCIVFLSACLAPTDNILQDSFFRLRDTSLGICIALVINIAIRPYNNKKRILSLLKELMAQIPLDIELIVVREQFPDLTPSVELLRRLDHELELYHSQRLFHRKNDDEALLQGCIQLAQRMIQELEVICAMDSLGDLASENEETMRNLGLELPERGIQNRKCTRRDTIVMNYHLDKIFAAYHYLQELIQT
ncbi:MAG: FUSC family protein [Oscillospiraceae bacterium]|nr:FUSC family protein [Oscillospiraceae bacterium]